MASVDPIALGRAGPLSYLQTLLADCEGTREKRKVEDTLKDLTQPSMVSVSLVSRNVPGCFVDMAAPMGEIDANLSTARKLAMRAIAANEESASCHGHDHGHSRFGKRRGNPDFSKCLDL